MLLYEHFICNLRLDSIEDFIFQHGKEILILNDIKITRNITICRKNHSIGTYKFCFENAFKVAELV